MPFYTTDIFIITRLVHVQPVNPSSDKQHHAVDWCAHYCDLQTSRILNKCGRYQSPPAITSSASSDPGSSRYHVTRAQQHVDDVIERREGEPRGIPLLRIF